MWAGLLFLHLIFLYLHLSDMVLVIGYPYPHILNGEVCASFPWVNETYLG